MLYLVLDVLTIMLPLIGLSLLFVVTMVVPKVFFNK